MARLHFSGTIFFAFVEAALLVSERVFEVKLLWQFFEVRFVPAGTPTPPEWELRVTRGAIQ